jgi:phenol hydroxylase P5 protein
VLDACLREGVWLPHACTHGTCGTCKSQVLDGDLDLGDASPYALLESERDEGAALICVARPRSDLTIEGEVDLDEGVNIHPVRDFTGTLTGLQDAAPDVRRLRIELDRPMAFNAGQYVQLQAPSWETRPYSVASAPSSGSRIELHVKRYAAGPRLSRSRDCRQACDGHSTGQSSDSPPAAGTTGDGERRVRGTAVA